MLAFLLALMIVGADEPAPTTAEAPAPAVTPGSNPTVRSTQPGGDRLVCKREAKANSRFTTKVCKTVDEWEERAETARQAFNETQQRPMVDISKGN